MNPVEEMVMERKERHARFRSEREKQITAPIHVPEVKKLMTHIQAVIAEHERFLHFVDRCEDDSLTVFEHTAAVYDRNQSVKSTFSHQEGRASLQEFVAYCSSHADRYFQGWLLENGIEDALIIRPRQGVTSLTLGIYRGATEYAQISLRDRYFGFREPVKSREAIEQEVENTLERIDKDIREIQEQIQLLQEFYDEPWSRVKSLKDAWIVLFKGAKIRELSQEKIANYQVALDSIRADRMFQVEWIEEKIEEAEEKGRISELLLPFFQHIGYRQEMNRDRLY